MRLRDLILVLATLGGMLLGGFIPATAERFKDWTPYLLMGLLFLSFLRLDLSALVHPQTGSWLEVLIWSLVKLALLPIAVWAILHWLWPEWALAALVLSAVSTGVSCPFYATLLHANLVRVVLVVVTTSLALPLTMPALIRLLTGAETEVPFWPMFRALAMLIFLPAAAMALCRRWVPALVETLGRFGYPLSLALMFVISAIVFAPIGQHFQADPGNFLEALALATVLCAVYLAVGLWLPRLLPERLTPLTGMVGLVYINNVLGVVFAARFLDFHSVLLCGCYLFPIYVALLPLRYLRDRLSWVST